MHKWNYGFLAASGILLATWARSPYPVSAQSTSDWAKKALEQWYAAHDGGDAHALVRLYLDDAVLFEPDETARGRKAIEARYEKEFQKVRSSCTWAIDGQHMVGKQAAVWGHATCVGSRSSGGATNTTKGRWLTIFERQLNGSWLIARDAGEDAGP